MKLKYLFNSLAVVALAAFSSCTDNDYTELNKGSEELALTADATEVILSEVNHSSEAFKLTWTSGTNYGTGARISYDLEISLAENDFADPVFVYTGETQKYSWAPNVESFNNTLLNQLGVRAGETVNVAARVTAHVAGLDETQVATTQFAVTAYKPVTSTLYIIGDAAPNGWSADNAAEMTRSDNGIFTWIGKLNVGEFKFITTRGQFMPSYNNDGNGNLIYRDSDDQPDLKFAISEAKTYQVDVNLLTLTISVAESAGETPAFDALYFVGNETGWGFWQMSKDILDPYLFRLGILFEKGGEFKFGTSDGSWENMYKATEDNAPYTNSSVEFVKGFDPDKKWVLKDDEMGVAYKICFDIRTGKERMLMTPFLPYENIYLVGEATPNGWDLGKATAMTATDDPYVFTWTGNLNEGELKFSCDKQSDWNGAWFLASKGNMEPTGGEEQMLFADKSSDACKAQYLDVNIGDVDQKWKITSAGNYTITLDQLHETVTIAKN